MPRPRSILWVDDEIESLTSHVMFLEEQGFAVDTSAHGDDALVMLQRQPYGVVLLDEQMPGRRGLELFRAIRSMDQSMPVVMVTKSEEPETFKDALGAEISDYLVKPVNPRQILTVVTRLLEGDRIRQQRLSRDFASRFRELEARRGARARLARVDRARRRARRVGSAPRPGRGARAAGRAAHPAGEPAPGLREVPPAQLRQLAPRRPQRPAAALGGHRRRVPAPGAAVARQGAAGRGRLPAPRPVGHDPPPDRRAVRHRDLALLLDPAHRHAVRAERDLLRALSRRRSSSATRSGGPTRTRTASTRTRDSCSSSS